ncbi:predicted protein [Histoplasma mississippiense (nom. inval.)]|uniref:predicted protein n=1 Tax=Ajellomyces capsulatus (strain NAm1 / WU24) TaxID=2059318 RepID=UPI000157CE78|nr:predicted protein [Histoplasma mississippiense (nom. inval.)]EDN10010.1 predicted protein [Histoplasma mississippiense (nom. inval.)]
MANPSVQGELNYDNSFQVSPRSTLKTDFDAPVLSKISQSGIGQVGPFLRFADCCIAYLIS